MALREIIASFGIEFDKEGNLAKGDKAVTGMAEKLADFGKTVAGAFAVHEIISFGREILEQADALAKQSGALGVSAAELQGWQWAAKLSGSSAEEFSAAFTKFTRNVNEAGEAAGGPAAKALRDLGLSLDDVKNKAPIDLLDGVVAGLEGIQSPAKRTALVMDLFGKSGARLLPLFSEGEEGIKKLRAEVGELGASFDEAFLEDAQEVNDNIDRLKLGVRGLAISVLKEVLPGISAFAKQAVEAGKSFIGWIKGTRIIQAGLVALSAKGIGLLLRSVPMLIAKFGGLTSTLAALGRFVLRTILPFLLLEDAIVFLAGGKSAIGKGLDKIFGDGTAEAARASILTWFENIKAVITTGVGPALKGMGEALKAIGQSELFRGVAKGALDALLAVLNAIGLALTDNAERAEKLSKALHKNLSDLGIGPSEEERAKTMEEGLPEKQEALPPAQSFFRKAVTSILGDPLDGPGARADAEHNRQVQARREREKQGAIVAPSAAAPVSYTDAYSTASTTAAAPAIGQSYTQQTTNAPINTVVNVRVEAGADQDIGNRVGQGVAKAVAPVNLRAVKAALVPTPG